MDATARYLAFLPMHTPSKHRVLAVVDRGDGEVVEAVATFPDPAAAVALAEGLTGVLLRQVDADARIAAALTDAPDSVRSAVTTLVANLASGGADDEPDLSRVAVALRRPLPHPRLPTGLRGLHHRLPDRLRRLLGLQGRRL